MTDDFKDIEQQLNAYMETLKSTELPTMSEGRLQAGIEKIKRKHRRLQGFKIGGLTAAVLLIGFMLLANFSTSFLKVTADVPLVSDLVKLVKLTEDDQGLQEAVKNGYVQPVHVKDTEDGVTFEVSNIVVDHSRLVVFYNASTNDDRQFWSDATKIQITNSNDKRLENSTEYDTYNLEGKTHGSGKIDINLKQDVPITNIVKFMISIPINDGTKQTTLTFNVDIPINQKMINAKRVYPVKQWVTLDSQRIYIKKVVLFPTQTEVDIRFDKNNSKKVLYFQGLHLEDQNGKPLTQAHNGFQGDREWTLYLSNLHYTQPKTPILVVNKVMAIDKDQAEVLVNLHDKKIIKAPKEIILNEVAETTNSYILRFTLKAKNFQSDFLGGVILDGAGKKINALRGSSSTDERKANETVEIPKEKYQEPLSIEISGYPSYLKGEVRIPLKK